MDQAELWTSLLSAIDPLNVKAMPVALQSTIELLESELAKARAALVDFHGQTSASLGVKTAAEEEEEEEAKAASQLQLVTRVPEPRASISHIHRPLQLTAPPSPKYVPLEADWRKMMPVRKPSPLLRVLSNSLVLDHLAPYLPVSGLLSLASTSKHFRSLITETSFVFRHVDLRTCRGAQIASDDPIDSGGQVWRNERMDESLTEDEFYCGPLRGIFANLERRSILQDVRTLVLDGLTVPADLVAEILTASQFNISILSIRECRHLNERKLMQAIQYAVRPSRPKGMPRVKGIYYFSPKDPSPSAPVETSSSSSCGSRIFRGRRWYEPTGRVLTGSVTAGWASTLQLCQGIISFDVVLCRSPRHDPDLYRPGIPNTPADPFLLPAVATIAVGPDGCANCGSAPEGPAVWDKSPEEYFPLLSPTPLHSSRITAAKCPRLYPGESPILLLRCEECIVNRRCSRCKRWWCSTCVPRSSSANNSPPRTPATQGSGHLQRMDAKVFDGFCMECRG
jgi:hypothetical protein